MAQPREQVARSERRWKRILRWIWDRFPSLVVILSVPVSAIGAAALGLPDETDLADKKVEAVLLLGGLTAALGGSIWEIFRRDRLSLLRGRIGEAEGRATLLEGMLLRANQDYLATIDTALAAISETLDFTDRERISLYRHTGSHFQMLGRHAESPAYRGKGRSVYVDDQGVIGAAWLSGSAFEQGLPDADRRLDNYVRLCGEKWNVPDEVVRGLRMKSRTLAAFALKDAHENRSAVIVFESMDPGSLDEESLARHLETTQLARILQLFAETEPALDLAYREGL